MEIIDLKDSRETIASKIHNESHIRCDLIALNAFGKDRLRFLIKELLVDFEKEDIAEDVSASVLELAFNAIKANYAHVETLERIKRTFPERYPKINSNDIYEDRLLAKTYVGLTKSPEIRDKVKDAIRKEAQVLRMHEKAESENRELNEAEREQTYAHLETMMKTRRENVKVTLRIAKSDNKLVFDLVNDAPITEHGLSRIAEKRANFRTYYEEDRVGEFYMDNLDETESAGFGSAMIDSRLLAWGLEPTQHFVVTLLNYKTCASLVLSFDGSAESL